MFACVSASVRPCARAPMRLWARASMRPRVVCAGSVRRPCGRAASVRPCGVCVASVWRPCVPPCVHTSVRVSACPC
eukprot:4629148-Alexandrium_andersonii.AAC.1